MIRVPPGVEGTVAEAIRVTGEAKRRFTADDIRARAAEYVRAFSERTSDYEVIYASKALPATAAYRLLKENPNPSEDEIRLGISGNLCRCTGYQNIVKAIQYAAAKLAGAPVTEAAQ